MKAFIILFFIPLCASAEIYKCIDKGQTIFSDSPCGDNAKKIHIEPQVNNGYELSNSKLEKLADDMQSDRLKKELEHQIEKQLDRIEAIETTYLKTISSLESELRELKAAKRDYKWSGNEYKRKNYYKKKNESDGEIASTKRKYKSDRRLAYIELNELKRRQYKQ